MPPPPPPPICLHFFGGKKNRPRLTYSEHSATEDYSSRRSSIDHLGSDNSYSSTATLTSRAETFDVNGYYDAARDITPALPVLKRSNTISTAKEKQNRSAMAGVSARKTRLRLRSARRPVFQVPLPLPTTTRPSAILALVPHDPGIL